MHNPRRFDNSRFYLRVITLEKRNKFSSDSVPQVIVGPVSGIDPENEPASVDICLHFMPKTFMKGTDETISL
jgi:hypothetical protein